MAPATRRASAAAASAAASGPCRLLALSDDEVSAVAHELCDPLRPLLAVNLSSTAKGLRVAMQPALAELRLQRQAAVALAALCGRSPAGLRDTRELCLGPNHGKPLSLAHWRTLGNLIGCRSLLRLESLAIHEGVALLAAGLRRGGMPSLTRLVLYKAQIGDQGAAALAAGLTKRSLPALKILSLGHSQIGDAGLAALAPALRQLPRLNILFLGHNQIGDAGLAALAPALRQLPRLMTLNLSGDQIGDRGLASLLAEPMQGVLPSLHYIYLESNLLTDSGLAALSPL